MADCSEVSSCPILAFPTRQVRIPVPDGLIIYLPETSRVLHANHATMSLLDLLTVPCTLSTAERRLAGFGLTPGQGEVGQVVSDLLEKRCLRCDGDFMPERHSVDAAQPMDPKVPKFASIHLTDRCNLSCVYCYNRRFRADSRTSDLSAESWRKILRSLLRSGVARIDVTGGEPLLRTDLFPVLREARQDGAYLCLLTNGCLVERVGAEEIGRTFDSVAVSIDSHTEEVADALRGKGTYAAVLSALKSMSARGIHVAVNCVITTLNIDCYQESRQFFLENGAKSVTPMIMQPPSSGETNLRPTAEQLERFLDSNYDALTSECGYEELYKNSKIGWVGRKRSCGAAISEFAVGSDGTIYPCRMLMESEFAGGNLLEENLEEVWSSSERLRSVRSLTYESIEECRGCDFFNICIGGCRGSAYKLTGDLGGWIGSELCHEHKQLLKHKLVISMRAAQEEGRKSGE